MSEQDMNQMQEEFTPEDIEKNKVISGLAYLLFFLPLIACPDSKFGKFHANQALILVIVSIIGNVILGVIPVVGWILLPFYGIAMLILMILGLVNGLNGQAKELPIIGKYRIIK
ncbi:MAG: hypothetical protein K0S71_2782 [Clostridia bacterium]|jgi:uncharacterized membrane protein|nr:hypothetical protein [Clostridia bacterium]